MFTSVHDLILLFTGAVQNHMHCFVASVVAEFFEECIEEERYAADKLTIMRDAIHATPQYKKSAGEFVEMTEAPASPVAANPPVNGHTS